MKPSRMFLVFFVVAFVISCSKTVVQKSYPQKFEGLTQLVLASETTNLDFEEEIRLDTHYVENWSLGLDFVLALKTPLVMFFGKHRIHAKDAASPQLQFRFASTAVVALLFVWTFTLLFLSGTILTQLGAASVAANMFGGIMRILLLPLWSLL